VKPARGFAFAESVRTCLAEAQLGFGDGVSAATTFRAPGRGWLDRVRHARIFEPRVTHGQVSVACAREHLNGPAARDGAERRC
jgi:hypothetical protein